MKPKLEQFGLTGQVVGAKTVEVIAVAHKENERVWVSLWALDGTKLGQTLQLPIHEARPILDSLGWEP